MPVKGTTSPFLGKLIEFVWSVRLALTFIRHDRAIRLEGAFWKEPLSSPGSPRCTPLLPSPMEPPPMSQAREEVIELLLGAKVDVPVPGIELRMLVGTHNGARSCLQA
jgi:hypothetical protein